MNSKEDLCTLEQIPANRKLVDDLYAHGKITLEAKECALNFLYPHNQWGSWISRLLLIVGCVLVLSGVIHFFAFNWAKIPPGLKLFLIEFLIVGSLMGACFYSLEKIEGKAFLLSASVLVGVFMAVFGQIYQTGANAYELFMMWSLLTLGWTLLSSFVAQWIFWLVVTNVFLVLWWQQSAFPVKEMKFMVFTYMAALNGIALALGEYLALRKAYDWLNVRWARMFLSVITLLIMLIPIVAWVLHPRKTTTSIMFSATIGLMGHGFFYYVYRYRLRDVWILIASLFSSYIILGAIGFKILSEIFSTTSEIFFLLSGLMTLGILTHALMFLKKTVKEMEINHASV
jgi:uncharacterized membrane protein